MNSINRETFIQAVQIAQSADKQTLQKLSQSDRKTLLTLLKTLKESPDTQETVINSEKFNSLLSRLSNKKSPLPRESVITRLFLRLRGAYIHTASIERELKSMDLYGNAPFSVTDSTSVRMVNAAHNYIADIRKLEDNLKGETKKARLYKAQQILKDIQSKLSNEDLYVSMGESGQVALNGARMRAQSFIKKINPELNPEDLKSLSEADALLKSFKSKYPFTKFAQSLMALDEKVNNKLEGMKEPERGQLSEDYRKLKTDLSKVLRESPRVESLDTKLAIINNGLGSQLKPVIATKFEAPHEDYNIPGPLPKEINPEQIQGNKAVKMLCEFLNLEIHHSQDMRDGADFIDRCLAENVFEGSDLEAAKQLSNFLKEMSVGSEKFARILSSHLEEFGEEGKEIDFESKIEAIFSEVNNDPDVQAYFENSKFSGIMSDRGMALNGKYQQDAQKLVTKEDTKKNLTLFSEPLREASMSPMQTMLRKIMMIEGTKKQYNGPAIGQALERLKQVADDAQILKDAATG